MVDCGHTSSESQPTAGRTSAPGSAVSLLNRYAAAEFAREGWTLTVPDPSQIPMVSARAAEEASLTKLAFYGQTSANQVVLALVTDPNDKALHNTFCWVVDITPPGDSFPALSAPYGQKPGIEHWFFAFVDAQTGQIVDSQAGS
jgi:hypothetical protein